MRVDGNTVTEEAPWLWVTESSVFGMRVGPDGYLYALTDESGRAKCYQGESCSHALGHRDHHHFAKSRALGKLLSIPAFQIRARRPFATHVQQVIDERRNSDIAGASYPRKTTVAGGPAHHQEAQTGCLHFRYQLHCRPSRFSGGF